MEKFETFNGAQQKQHQHQHQPQDTTKFKRKSISLILFILIQFQLESIERKSQCHAQVFFIQSSKLINRFIDETLVNDQSSIILSSSSLNNKTNQRDSKINHLFASSERQPENKFDTTSEIPLINSSLELIDDYNSSACKSKIKQTQINSLNYRQLGKRSDGDYLVQQQLQENGYKVDDEKSSIESSLNSIQNTSSIGNSSLNFAPELLNTNESYSSNTNHFQPSDINQTLPATDSFYNANVDTLLNNVSKNNNSNQERTNSVQQGHSSNSNDSGQSDSCKEAIALSKALPSRPTQLFYSFIYWFLFVFGLVGNSLTLSAIFRKREKLSVMDIFIANLALSDIMLCLFADPITPVYLLYIGYWTFGAPLCKVFAFAQGSSVYISTFTLTAIAQVRYKMVVHPASRILSTKVGYLVCIIIWLLGPLVSLPYISRVELFPENCPIQFCDEIWDVEGDRLIFSFTNLTLQFFVPLFAFGFFYGSIYAKVQEQKQKRDKELKELYERLNISSNMNTNRNGRKLRLQKNHHNHHNLHHHHHHHHHSNEHHPNRVSGSIQSDNQTNNHTFHHSTIEIHNADETPNGRLQTRVFSMLHLNRIQQQQQQQQQQEDDLSDEQQADRNNRDQNNQESNDEDEDDEDDEENKNDHFNTKNKHRRQQNEDTTNENVVNLEETIEMQDVDSTGTRISSAKMRPFSFRSLTRAKHLASTSIADNPSPQEHLSSIQIGPLVIAHLLKKPNQISNSTELFVSKNSGPKSTKAITPTETTTTTTAAICLDCHDETQMANPLAKSETISNQMDNLCCSSSGQLETEFNLNESQQSNELNVSKKKQTKHSFNRLFGRICNSTKSTKSNIDLEPDVNVTSHQSINRPSNDVYTILRQRALEKDARSRKTNMKIFLFVKLFVFAWLPLNLFNLIQDIFSTVATFSYIKHVFLSVHLVACSSVCFNPVLYCWLSENHRQEILDILPRNFVDRFFKSTRNNMRASRV